MFRVVFVALTLIALNNFSAASETVAPTNQTTAPLAVRQEKAQGLLRLWGYASQDLMTLFRINQPEDIDQIERALTFSTRIDKNTTGTLTPAVERYLTSFMARNQMIDSLDFSEPKLRHFFDINPKRYPCTQTAKAAEFLVPRAYVADLQTTAILDEISSRVTIEDFAKVAYDITGRFGKPGTGLIGDVTKDQAGEQRFSFYEQAHQKGGVAGPFELPEGYLFVKVYSYMGSQENCFQFLRETVARDYGREWLKKITNDTLTTITRELRPIAGELTTVPLSTEIAFVINGKPTTFGEARAMLSYLFGNEATIEFWKSIQRQALEMELIYQSEIGQRVRQTPEFETMKNLQIRIGQAQAEIDGRLSKPPTTATLEHWFRLNQKRFLETGLVSYTLYNCSGSNDALINCAAELKKLDTELTSSDTSDTIKVEEYKAVQWNAQSREVQAATQELAVGEWSEVFSLGDKPARIYLQSIERRIPDIHDSLNDVIAAWEVAERLKFWREFSGVQD